MSNRPSKELRQAWLRDLLYNTSADVAHTASQIEYGKGCFVGAVSTTMSLRGMLFAEAFHEVLRFAPKNMVQACIPDVWLKEIKQIERRGF